MPKDSRGADQDSMTREVDRLLAQLASTGRPAVDPPARSSSGPQRRIIRVSSATTVSRADRIGLWARVTLGVALGGLMTQWPYLHSCGLPLAGYLGAVAMVMVAGAWGAIVSWKQRSASAHVVALLLILWGIALGTERVLPRISYAVEPSTWTCPEASAPAWLDPVPTGAA
jgi:hypothetical protein